MRGRTALVAATLTVVLAASGCGAGPDPVAAGQPTLTLYNAQHEDLMRLMVDGFTKETGIKVNLRSGDDSELAHQLVAEGKASPADVFVTENSPAMTLVEAAGGFAKVDQDTLAQVPPQFAPRDGRWVGFAARSTVMAYNKGSVPAGSLPASILDLAAPRWRGQVGIAPAGADFQAIVSAVVAVAGPDRADQWLRGLKANAKIYRGNTAILKAVDRGEIKAGIIYHYYWFKDQAESGANSSDTALHYFGAGDAGGFLSVSGAGVLAGSKHPAAAQELVKFLDSRAGQQILADSAAMEYPIAKGATANPALKPLAQLDPPRVEISSLNGPQVVGLLQKAGLL